MDSRSNECLVQFAVASVAPVTLQIAFITLRPSLVQEETAMSLETKSQV